MRHPNIRLIAHRGGVVDSRHEANSLSALMAAVDRAYWMVEVDLRESKDGVLFLHHDPALASGLPRLADMTWSEILRAKDATAAAEADGRAAGRCPTFESVLERCAGRTLLMIDTKERPPSTRLLSQAEETLRRHGLLADTCFIGSPESKRFFLGKAHTAVHPNELKTLDDWTRASSSRQFVFGHAADIDRWVVDRASECEVPVVASINLYHYRSDTVTDAGRADISRLFAQGVRIFQIDSAFEQVFDGLT